MERALRRTSRETVDLLQYHTWTYDDPSWLDHVFELDELRREGLIAHLGVTNMDTAHLRMLLESGVQVASNQVCYSLIDRRAQGAMTALCEQYGVKLLAYGSLAGGLLTDAGLEMSGMSATEMPSWSLMKYRRFVDAIGGWERFRRALNVLADVARRIDSSPAHVAIRYVMDSPGVAGVIVGSRLDRDTIAERNLPVFDVRLDDDYRAQLEEAFGALDQIPGDCGDEYRKPPFLTASGDLSHHVDEMPRPYPVIKRSDGRTLVLSGTKWEDAAGYARAVRVGDRIVVSGTTATHGDRLIGGDDAQSQTHFCIDKIKGAIRSLGGSLGDVVRTRLFVADMSRWEEVALAHGERLGQVQPANTLVGAELVGNGYLVEMEAEAKITT